MDAKSNCDGPERQIEGCPKMAKNVPQSNLRGAVQRLSLGCQNVLPHRYPSSIAHYNGMSHACFSRFGRTPQSTFE